MAQTEGGSCFVHQPFKLRIRHNGLLRLHLQAFVCNDFSKDICFHKAQLFSSIKRRKARKAFPLSIDSRARAMQSSMGLIGSMA